MKSVNLNFLEPSGPLQACNGSALPLPFYKIQMNAAVQFVALVTCSCPDWFSCLFSFSVCPDKYRNNAPNLATNDPFILLQWGNCNNKNCPEHASERSQSVCLSVSLSVFWTIWPIFAKYGMHVVLIIPCKRMASARVCEVVAVLTPPEMIRGSRSSVNIRLSLWW